MEVSAVIDLQKLQRFCNECRLHGFVNNDTIEKHKLGWVKENDGVMLAAYLNGDIISVAGCHRIEGNSFRVCFRGAQIPERDTYKGISKLHFNSIPWRVLLPGLIEWCDAKGAERLYVTTNTDNDKARLAHTNRALTLLSKQGIVTLDKTEEYFGVMQNFWLLNTGAYYESRKVLHNWDEARSG